MNNRFSLFDFALDNKEIYIDLQTLCNLFDPLQITLKNCNLTEN